MEERKRNRIKKILLITVLLLFALCSVGALYTYLFLTPIVISGESMYPTLQDNEFGYVDHQYFSKKNLKRNQIIAFFVSGNEDYFYIKRVVGLPNETFHLNSVDGNIFINGEKISQEYIPESIKQKTCSSECVFADQDIVLKENQYFVLGDNRENSHDSAHGLGLVEEENILGVLKVILGNCSSKTCNFGERNYRFISDWKFYS